MTRTTRLSLAAFRHFTIETIETTYSASRSGNNRKAKELLITTPKRRSSRR